MILKNNCIGNERNANKCEIIFVRGKKAGNYFKLLKSRNKKDNSEYCMVLRDTSVNKQYFR